MSKTVIHFIRHGEVLNPKNIFYGRLPGFPLSDEGRECVRYMANQLGVYPIEAIYSSPLLRTKQSAEIIADQLKLPVREDDRLIEIATPYEGRDRGQRTTVPHYPQVKSSYVETMAEIYDRMAHFVREQAEQWPDCHLVAVSHNGPLRILQLGLEGRPLTEAIFGYETIPTCGADLLVTVKGENITVEKQDLICLATGHKR